MRLVTNLPFLHKTLCNAHRYVQQFKVATKMKSFPAPRMIYMVQWASWIISNFPDPNGAYTYPVFATDRNKHCPQCLRSFPSKAPVSSTICPAPCCCNREHTWGRWRNKPATATSNLIMGQPKTPCSVGWLLTLSWCPETWTLQLLHSTSYNQNHNLTSVIVMTVLGMDLLGFLGLYTT